MRIFKLQTEVLDHLNEVLSLELMAVQQHFIHVLILKAWGDDEIAHGIIDIDNVDLPNTMQIIDVMVANDYLPNWGTQDKPLSAFMPAPGNTYNSIIKSERLIESQLVDALSVAERAFDNDCVPPEILRLVSDPLFSRAGFEVWMQNIESGGFKSNHRHESLSKLEKSALDDLFAHLMIVINQEIIHSFVHWHNGKIGWAKATWAASSAAMMQATDITNLLALRNLAPAPCENSVPKEANSLRIGKNADDAILFDQALADLCYIAAKKATSALVNTEYEQICRRCAEYFRIMRTWQPGDKVPEIKNPCVDFERVLHRYVYGTDVQNKPVFTSAANGYCSSLIRHLCL